MSTTLYYSEKLKKTLNSSRYANRVLLPSTLLLARQTTRSICRTKQKTFYDAPS